MSEFPVKIGAICPFCGSSETFVNNATNEHSTNESFYHLECHICEAMSGCLTDLDEAKKIWSEGSVFEYTPGTNVLNRDKLMPCPTCGLNDNLTFFHNETEDLLSVKCWDCDTDGPAIKVDKDYKKRQSKGTTGDTNTVFLNDAKREWNMRKGSLSNV